LFFIDLEPSENNKEVYKITALQNKIIQIEPPREKKNNIMATRNPTAIDLSRASNVADTTTAKNVQRATTHQQHAHYAEVITQQTTGGANTTTTHLKKPIHTETSYNALNQHTPI
jgi:hypothetical protein